ncbi:MAG: hypothetical protein AAB573_04590 [Patescibacteria group bacterium]
MGIGKLLVAGLCLVGLTPAAITGNLGSVHMSSFDDPDARASRREKKRKRK